MSPTDGLWLRMTRVLPAESTEVWRALTDAALLARWWGPKGFTVPSVEFEPAIGEALRITMQPAEGEPFRLEGEFREVIPPSLLSFTFRWEPPAADDRETLVTLAIEDRGELTEVELTQGAFATEERLALHDAGWTESFEKLTGLIG
jgi:uncharacterized protein YndB with AHSA1/START domain